MEFSEVAELRRSVRDYQSGIEIDDDELNAIFEKVILSPSSFNIQHWRFVVVRDAERKKTLRGLSFGQAQVEQCAAAIVVCGNLDAHEDAARIYADAPEEAQAKYVPMIEGVYHDQQTLQREEAIRSGALAAMSLMYAACDLGWDTGPMIGFDAGKVADFLNLGARIVPVMMVVIGRASPGSMSPRGFRRPVSEVVQLETLDGKSLS